MEKIAVIGGGSWGTALANLLAVKGIDTLMWVYEKDLAADINDSHENTIFLKGHKLSNNLRASNDFAEVLKDRKFILNVVPSHAVRSVFQNCKGLIEEGSVIVSASKGIEQETNLTVSQILSDVLKEVDYDFAVLSGPTFAKDVVAGKPTALTVASAVEAVAIKVQDTFTTDKFRVYRNDDVIGVELGGVLKNVIAIASGISDGLGLGYNARAALITRGLFEVSKLGVAMGAKHETFFGLSGMGDLVLTCTGALSRNYTVGTKLGEGKSLDEILDEMHMVAEGVKTAKAVHALAKEHNVDMPISETVFEILYEGKAPIEAVKELLSRTITNED